jgi:hypothetical protein
MGIRIRERLEKILRCPQDDTDVAQVDNAFTLGGELYDER